MNVVKQRRYDAKKRDQEMDKLKEEIDHLVMYSERRTNGLTNFKDTMDAMNGKFDAQITQLKVVENNAFSKRL